MTIILAILCVALSIMLIVNWRLTLSDRAYQKALRKQTSEQLSSRIQEQERELELLLNAFDDALIIVDSKQVIKVANRAAIQLCRGRKLRGKTIIQAFLNEPVTDAIRKAIKAGEPTRKKITLAGGSFGQKKDYEESIWIMDVAPLQVSGIDGLSRVLLRDVTSQHKTDQIKREFVANASHELRTPLAIINGYIENLIFDDMVESPTIARKFLGIMQKHGARLSALVEDMLSVSKLESGDAGLLDPTEFALKDIFEDIIERLSPMTQQHNSKLVSVLSRDDLKLYADRFYWEQILFNLTENALKQNMQQKIKVTLKAEEKEGFLEISVKDNGKGIPSSHLPYIFNRFYRVQKHHSQNEIKGTGLGLSIVKHAVEAHNASITVESTPNESTIFKILVPQGTSPSEPIKKKE